MSTKFTHISKAILTCVVAATLGFAMIAKPALASLSGDERDSRLSHAHELLGKYYHHSVVRSGEQVDKVNGMIYRWARHSLPKAYKKQYQKIAQTIIDESLKYEFDPVFVISVITSESSFNPLQLGKCGEIGLMQIMPNTGKWMAQRTGTHWKNKSILKDPVTNIKLGTAYLAYLREKFDSQARLYLAAYNMGQGNVKDALSRKIWPKEYAMMVMKHYIEYYDQVKSQADAD